MIDIEKLISFISSLVDDYTTQRDYWLDEGEWDRSAECDGKISAAIDIANYIKKEREANQN